MADSSSSRHRGARLPGYLSRHMSLGFDSDDVAALVSSIDSSQDLQSSKLPHLPAEILFHILEFVPVDYVLTWRLVCRGFRDAINGPVQYEHLKRAELIGYLGPHAQYPLDQLSESSYDQIKFIRAHFEQIDDMHTAELHSHAKWNHDEAIFTLEDAWFQGMERIEDQTTKEGVMRPAWQSLLDDLQLHGDEISHGALTWCLRLDKTVMDITPSPEVLGEYMAVDLVNKKIVVWQWKTWLFSFLKTETRLRLLTYENRDAAFTFGLQEDCLRAVRRERLRAVLDLENRDHRLVNWEINTLRPLFGKRRYDKASSGFIGLESMEDDATAILSFLRKEASMSKSEVAYLRQLSMDRASMERDLQTLSSTIGDWQSTLFGVKARHNWVDSLPKVPQNPAAWSDELRLREEERINTWQSQRKLIAKLAGLLNGSIEAMSLPEGAFDDSEYDL